MQLALRTAIARRANIAIENVVVMSVSPVADGVQIKYMIAVRALIGVL